MSSITSTNVANWRVLNEGDEPSHILSERGIWGETQYHEGLQLYQKLTECSDSYIKDNFQSALQILQQALRLYGPASVICSFNGGKDAVAILHLVRAAMAQFYAENEQVTRHRPRVIYFDNPKEFPEILDFVHQSVAEYDLEMIAFAQGTKFADGLEVLVDGNHAPKDKDTRFPMAFVLGTRSTDPNAGDQGSFAPSSSYMPPFMRVNPILEWSYGHIWHFLRLYHLPYCALYDQGYTSLGSVADTLPCPALAVAGVGDGNECVPKYWPAYMLRDYDQERAGRIPKNKKDGSKPSSSQKQKLPMVEDSASLGSSLGQLSTYSIVKPSPDETGPAMAQNAPSVVSYSGNEHPRKVGLLIIGDEILKGQTTDTNTQAAAIALREQNVLLQRVVVVSDNLDEICHEIQEMQHEVDAIITSGGVGPTHDDVTIKSVAAALGCELELHSEMADLLRNKMQTAPGAPLSEAQIKMATLPSKSKLRYLSENKEDWPVLQCQNIFVLPGVPKYFHNKIEMVAEYLSCQLERSVAYKVVLSIDENHIVPALNQVVENHPTVTIGSYPYVSHPEVKTVLTVEGRLQAVADGRRNSSITKKGNLSSKELMDRRVRLALDELLTTLPDDSILRVENEDQLLFD